ncbi:MAG: hypothetical protein IPM96_11680 [Ignavibacteria bacterium]|nr:hypothetical protein [Ignavibacteria bacterium]
MAGVSAYLNYPRNTEVTFNFCRSVLGVGFTGGISGFSDIPPSCDMPSFNENNILK